MDILLLLSSIVAGAFTVLALRLDDRAQVKLFNAFTGAYLICVTFLHLLPEVYGAGHDHDHEHVAALSARTVGVLILAGFFVQIVLDCISLGVEHGHSHAVHGRLPVGVIAGLCLHAFVEAMALGSSTGHHDPASRRMLLWSIVIHNYPVSVALLGMLLQSGIGRKKSLIWLGVFAAMAPLGMAISAVTPLAQHTRELTAVVIGIFLHVSTTILFESSDLHRFNWAKVVAIVSGVALGSLTVLFH